jgi:O-antigen/teichoic acid export membrane protein
MKPARNPFGKRQFQRALRYFVVGRSMQAIASISLTLMTVRVLSPNDYGAYMVLWGLIELARPLTSMGLLPALQQFLPEMALHASQAQLRKFLRVMSAARFLLLSLFAVLMYVAWDSLASWLRFEPSHVGAAGFACVLIVSVLLTDFTDHALDALLEQRFAQLVRALLPLIRLAGLLTLVLAERVSLLALLTVDLASSLLCLLLAELALVRRLQAFSPDGSRHFNWREIGGFIANMSVAQILLSLGNQGLLRIVVVSVLGLQAAGQFAFLQQLLTQVNRFLPSLLLANLVRPMLVTRHLRGEDQAVEVGAGLLWKSNLVLIWPMAAVMFIFGDWLVGLLSGSRFPESGLAMGFMMLAAVSNAQGQITAMLLQVYRYSGLVRNISALALATPVLVWAGAQHGVAGAAASVALAMWFRSSTSLYVLKQQPHGISLDWSGALRVLFALTAVAAAAATMEHVGVAHLITAATFVLLYAIAVLAVRPLHRDELALLLKAFGSRMAALARFTRS